MANTNRLSFIISSLLDSMGFSRHIIDFRINETRYDDIAMVFTSKAFGSISTGGTAEGTSVFGQGDIDLMYVLKAITVSGRHVDPPNPQHTVFYTEDMGVHPGYIWLRIGHLGELENIIMESLVLMVSADSTVTSYFSSSAFKQSHYLNYLQNNSINLQMQHISGPSLPILSNGFEFDNVLTLLHPDWPVQASQWVHRCLRHGWPPKSIVTAIAQCGCHVVPKGFTGSPSEHMEWCISFAVHEKSIVQLFNLTQKHVYILLKIIAKDIRESFPDLQHLVTSYTMKTVALWQVELHHARDWDRSHLLDRFMEALHFLKSCVESRNMPAYFIMENNLFDGKIKESTAARLSRLLTDVMSSAAGCVLTFPSIQQRLGIMQIPDRRHRLGVWHSGVEMLNLISRCCYRYLSINIYDIHILHTLSVIHSTDMRRHRSLTKHISKTMTAALAYNKVAKVKMAGISNRRKYELYRSLLHIASTNSGTDKMGGRVKFAGVLHVHGKTNQAIETLYSITKRPLFGVSYKGRFRRRISKQYSLTKTDSDNIEAVIIRFGRDKYVQKCVSLDIRYTVEEIDIVPDFIKYELFHVPETVWSRKGAYVDPDMLRYYLLYKCHSELGDEANADAAFINLIKIATQERFDPHMEFREVALNALGLCYMEKNDYLRAYICFSRAMSLRRQLLKYRWSTSTPWHLAVLASKLIKRPQVGYWKHQSIQPLQSYHTQQIRQITSVTFTRTTDSPRAERNTQQPSYAQFRRGRNKNAKIIMASSLPMTALIITQLDELFTQHGQPNQINDI